MHFQVAGWSLWDGACKDQFCLFEPITSASDLAIGDYVFCQLQPGGRFYAQKILHIGVDPAFGPEIKYTIWTNNTEGLGDTYRAYIYGRLCEVSERW